MRVVIDTNVLVSAALKDKDPQTIITWVVAHTDCLWLVSSPILSEYKSVLSRQKFRLPSELLERWFNFLDAATTTVIADPPSDFPRDAKDAIFLACATAASADYLISGDRDLVEGAKLLTTTILPVAMFKRLVCDAVP